MSAAEDYIRIYEKALPDEFCAALVQKFETLLSVVNPPDSKVQYGNTTAKRSDRAVMLEDHAPDMAGVLHGHLQRALDQYKDLFPALKGINFIGINTKLQRTEPGGGYHIWHCEQGDLASVNRILVWTVYLNDVLEGGETEFLHQHRRIAPVRGTATIFPAAFTHFHRGNPPLSGVKYIATGWWFITR